MPIPNALHVHVKQIKLYPSGGGGGCIRASYLVIDKILDAIRPTGADAVHPGYGFLFENTIFARALEKEGVTFIGAPVHAIHVMGDKITSKKLAAETGVSIVSGYMRLIENADDAERTSSAIGFPVMIKASAGGSGKGMRIAWHEEDLREGFQASKNEARSAFGDDRIFRKIHHRTAPY